MRNLRIVAWIIAGLILIGLLVFSYDTTVAPRIDIKIKSEIPAAIVATPHPPLALNNFSPEPSPSARKSPVSRTRPVAPKGVYADVTEYCATGNPMSNGQMPYVGAAAVLDRSIPFGTLVITDQGTYVVKDHVGSGTDVDLFSNSCSAATQFGRHHERVQYVYGSR